MIVYAPINQACVTLGCVCVCVYVSCRLSSVSLNRSKSDLKENRGDRKVFIYSSRPSLPPPPQHAWSLVGRETVCAYSTSYMGGTGRSCNLYIQGDHARYKEYSCLLPTCLVFCVDDPLPMQMLLFLRGLALMKMNK